MMATDEERRETAENISTMCAVCGIRYKEQFYDVLEETVMDCEDFHTFADVADRLADLMEPSCDLDALLSLERDMSNECDYNREQGIEGFPTAYVEDCVRRIREALGEVAR